MASFWRSPSAYPDILSILIQLYAVIGLLLTELELFEYLFLNYCCFGRIIFFGKNHFVLSLIACYCWLNLGLDQYLYFLMLIRVFLFCLRYLFVSEDNQQRLVLETCYEFKLLIFQEISKKKGSLIVN